MKNPLPRPARALAGTVAAGLTLVLLTGCGASSNPDSGAGAAESITLRVNWWGSDSRHALTQEVIDDFEADNPGITIQPEFSTFGDYFNKLSTSAASNDLPDVMHMTDPYMYQYIDNGQLLDLTTVEDVLPTDDYDATSLFGSEVDGGLYGIPAGLSGFGIFADPEAFAAAGVPLPDDETWTWDDMIDTITAISKATPEVAGYQLPLDEQTLMVYLRQQGQDLWTEDGEDIAFTEKTAEDYYSLIRSIADSGAALGTEQTIEAVGLGIEQSPMALGTVAMGVGAVPQLGALSAAAGHEFEVLLFPGEADARAVGSFAKPGVFWSVSTASEHPKEAARFVDYVANSTEAGSILKFDRGVPANTAVLESIEGDLTPTEQTIAEYFQRVAALDPSPFPHQNVDAGAVLVDANTRLTQEVLFGSLTPAQAAEQLMSEVTSAL